MILKKLSELWQKIIALKPRRLAIWLVVALSAFAAVFVFRGLFDIQRVVWIGVNGESPYSDEEIVAASEVEYGQQLFSLEPEKIEQNILKSKPYIREVRVSRWFFCYLRINVVADSPKYYIQISESTEEYYLLSEDLRVLDCRYSKESLEEAGLVFLELPDLKTCNMGQIIEYGEEGKNEFVLDIINYLNSQEYGNMITAIGLPGRFDGAYVTFYGRCRILLGKPTDIELKMDRARKHIDVLSGNGNIGFLEIDVSRDGETLISYPEKLD